MVVSNIRHFAPSAVWVKCEQCGVTFETTPKRTRGRFCSRTCFGRWQSANVRGAAHPNKGAKFGRPAHLPPALTKDCLICGQTFNVKPSHFDSRRTCSKKCFGKLKSKAVGGADNFNWKGGYQPYYGPSWQPAKKATRERDRMCQNCGASPDLLNRQLDVHHKIPFREFGVERHEEANRLSNLVALCNACHKLLEPHAAVKASKV